MTIRHGDLRPDNFFFDTDFRGSPVTLIDWQLTVRAKGVNDISYFATFGLTVNMRRKIEDRLVRLYHTTLVSEGVTDYDIEQCHDDYRAGILSPFLVMVNAGAILDFSDGRALVLGNALLERTFAAVKDHNILSMLRAM